MGGALPAHEAAGRARRPVRPQPRLRRRGLLDPELVGPPLGPPGLRPHLLRRLAGQRHRRVGRAARRAGDAAAGRLAGDRARRHRRPLQRLLVRRPAAARHQPGQRRPAARHRRVRHLGRRGARDLRGRPAAGHARLAGQARAAVRARRPGGRAQRDPAAGRLSRHHAGRAGVPDQLRLAQRLLVHADRSAGRRNAPPPA